MANLNDKPLENQVTKNNSSYEYEYKKIKADLKKANLERDELSNQKGVLSLFLKGRGIWRYYFLVLKGKYLVKKIEEFKYQRYNLGYSELLYRCLAEYNTIKSPAPPYLYVPLIVLGYVVMAFTLFDVWQIVKPIIEFIVRHESTFVFDAMGVGRRIVLEIICVLAILLNLKKMQKNKKLFIKRTNEANENVYLILKKIDISAVQLISEEIRYQQSNVNLKLSDKMLVIVTAFSGLAAVITLSTMLPFVVNWISAKAGNLDESVILAGMLISLFSLLPLFGAKSSLNKQLARLMGITYTVQMESKASAEEY